MKHFFACILLVSAVAAHGQETDKKRMVFEPGASRPSESPSPTPQPSQSVLWTNASPTPDAKKPALSAPPKVYHSKKTDPLDAAIDVFFLALQAGDIEVAYDTLVQNSPVADEPSQVADLKTKTASAIDTYGPIVGYELIDEKRAGENLVRRTYFSHGDTQPLRWRFYFYRIKDHWRLVDFRVDDGLLEFFEGDPVLRR